MAQNYYGSICLTDIPKEAITTAANGKKYLNIDVYERREVGQYGDTHNIKVSIKPELRVEGKNYYIGNLKPSRFDNGQQVAQSADVPMPPPQMFEAPNNDGDLPF